MTIASLLILPLIGSIGIILGKIGVRSGGTAYKDDSEYEKKTDHYADSNALLSDIVLNYRTIISFGEENID